MKQNMTAETHLPSWKYTHLKRWRITAILETQTALHIGSGEELENSITDSQGNPKTVQVNGFIKGKDDKPIIPGSSLKGKLRSFIADHADTTILNKVFGSGHESEDKQGNGGTAEFHDAQLCMDNTSYDHYPNWNSDKQTYIEASTAINRHTRTALEGSLHYIECVAPKTQFKVIITGDMQDQEAALIIKALGIFNDKDNTLYLGAESTNNKGKMELVGKIIVEQLGNDNVISWLNGDSSQTTINSHLKDNKLNEDEVKQLTKETPAFSTKDSNNNYNITLQFDSPFIVNDPSKNQDDDADQQPLTDADNQPILPVKSFRGAIRSQAERIIRTLGGDCCETATKTACKDTENLCIACQMFGTTDWKSTVNIEQFKFTGEQRPPVPQQFVAIDRFHGGGKDTALFNACYFEQAKFKGKLSLDIRKNDDNELSWRKGLLALLFRDLQEGDINFGFGMNKGYGSIDTEQTKVENQDSISDSDIAAFIQKCTDSKVDYPCKDIQTPDPSSKEQKTIKPDELDNNKFHNPYHFVPIKPAQKDTWFDAGENRDSLEKQDSPHSHAFYRDKTKDGTPLHHGRIICKLTAETPFFVGKGEALNSTEGSEAKRQEHYQLNNQLAIPATSLRGIISSLVESASNSSMRVLDNGLLSYRKPANSPTTLSALGMVVEKEDGHYLIPLTLPTLVGQCRLDSKYTTMFPDGIAKLKVYLNNAYSNGNAMQTFLANKNTWTRQTNEIYYLPLSDVKQNNGKVDSQNTNLRRASRRDQFVLGQKATQGNGVPSEQANSNMTPGILRILGKEYRNTGGIEIPQNKRHEIFIPVPQNFVDDIDSFLTTTPAFKIKQTAVNKYEQLAEQRTKSQKQEDITRDEERLPFNLKGTSRERDHNLRINTGDIVYFRPDQTGHEVEEIAFSAIWRDKVADTVNAFIPDTELLPFNSNREKISPAELLFGFTELNEDKDKRDHAKAYAGKVRIGAGTLSPESENKDDLQENEIMLKALSSPKLPSPALYFKTENGQSNHIAKQELNKSSHQAQGRKVYLHALKKDNGEVQKLSKNGAVANNDQANYPWETHDREDRPNLKVRIKPVKKGTSFYFQIDFNNLTNWELGLLCYALRPSENYRHKLGMGKPIGLGTVKIDIAALQTINRGERYRGSTKQHRYNAENWIHSDFKDDLKTKFEISTQTQSRLTPDKLQQIFIQTMDADIYQAIELLGNPHNIKHPVHYPQVSNENIENENFNWFVDNDKTHNKSLKSIDKYSNTIPTLMRYPKDD